MFTSKTRSFSKPRDTFDALKRCHVGQLIALLGAVALFVPPAAADTLEQTYAFSFNFDDPAFESVFQYTMDLPLFDAAGGAREMVGLRVDYALSWDYTYTVNPNLTSEWHGCNLSWTQVWSSTLDGDPWFPLDQSSGYFSGTGGVGAVCGPLFAGDGPIEVVGMGVEHPEVQTNPTVLARLTGVGTAAVQCTHTLSALTVATPDDRRWPPYVPQDQRIFDPNLIDLTMDRIGMDVTVTYYWNPVPEPTGFVLLGLGAVTLLRRR
jgi:hypothetical protein